MRILRLYFVSLLAAPPVISDEDIELYFVSLLAAPPVISDEDIETIFCFLISCLSQGDTSHPFQD